MAAMHGDSQRTTRRRTLSSILLLLGALGLLFGSGPLMGVIVAAKMGWTADPNPNPVGFGILAFFTFWPSVLLLVIGLAFRVAGR
ncbi:MAG: hypothetical protein FJ254_08910 [Phycisphaerae bacterium]|nr:hypothetical protein [Phycisphaerae bacterium]